MRPTGPLHLGHLVGALHNWVTLQDTHDSYFAIVDWHALTTDYADPSAVRGYVRDVALDVLASGVDPDKAVLFVQSEVKAHAELHLLLSMIVPRLATPSCSAPSSGASGPTSPGRSSSASASPTSGPTTGATTTTSAPSMPPTGT